MSRAVTRIGWPDIYAEVERIAATWEPKLERLLKYVYGIPFGGVPVAALVADRLGLQLCDEYALSTHGQNVLVIDDLVDSGKTLRQFDIGPCDALFRKPHSPQDLAPKARVVEGWVEFPWERDASESPAEDAVRRILQAIGEDPLREGLLETPKRVTKSWQELFSGYESDPAEVFKTFDADGYQQIVLLRDVELYSMCLVGSTFVETPRGRIPIERLSDGDWIYTLNEETGQFEVEQCRSPRITRRDAELVRVYADKDTVICTPDHKFMIYEKGWVEARDLKPEDHVVALNKGMMNGRPYMNEGVHASHQVPEHRIVAAGVLGRALTSRDHIHHVDGKPHNNSPDNFSCFQSRSEHSRHHAEQDGRGQREAPRLRNQANDLEFQMKRKAGLQAVHDDPERRAAMLAKRSESVRKSWEKRERGGSYRNHKIITVEPVSWREDVWCLNSPKNHNFVANGMVVHNCEHHMLPFVGRAHIAYIPKERVIGVSKLARLMEIFSRRLQIQERLGHQITDALMTFLEPAGAACIIEAEHFCMRMRGVGKQNSVMVTSSLRGVFMDEPAARAELMQMVFRR